MTTFIRAAPPRRIQGALDAASALGPFFRLGTDVSGSGWQQATDLYRPGPEGFLGQARGRLDTAEPRVAASISQLDYAARLWSPVLGCALLESVIPDLASLQVRQADWAQPVELALAKPGGWLASDVAQIAELSYRVVVEAHLEPLARALSDRVAAGLLRGNAASALAGALGVLVRARSAFLEPAGAVAAALLETGWLRGSGQLSVSPGGLSWRRGSCCLYYRLPGGGLCGDCCLTRPPGTG
jgi:ferric iron reductase protein FhuF